MVWPATLAGSGLVGQGLTARGTVDSGLLAFRLGENRLAVASSVATDPCQPVLVLSDDVSAFGRGPETRIMLAVEE
jgi:hypothetical protein